MTEVLRSEVGSGTVLVEVDDNSYGVNHPARNEQGILDAGRRLEDALASVRPAAVAAIDAMSELAPEHIAIEFGVKLAGEAGAVIARNTADGHFIVRMSRSTDAVIPREEEAQREHRGHPGCDHGTGRTGDHRVSMVVSNEYGPFGGSELRHVTASSSGRAGRIRAPPGRRLHTSSRPLR